MRAPPYSADRFPIDFVVSATAGLIAALIFGAVSWRLARHYLEHTYPGHLELLSAAIVIGVVDGFLFGIGGFIATFAVRIFHHERQLRRRSDQALRRELESLNDLNTGRGRRQRPLRDPD